MKRLWKLVTNMQSSLKKYNPRHREGEGEGNRQRRPYNNKTGARGLKNINNNNNNNTNDRRPSHDYRAFPPPTRYDYLLKKSPQNYITNEGGAPNKFGGRYTNTNDTFSTNNGFNTLEAWV